MNSAESLRNTTGTADVILAEERSEAVALDAERLLASRASSGERAAYGQLYEAYVDKIYRYIYYKVGQRADAEDLTSLTFMKAWDAIGDYEWRNHPFGAWLFRIAHNLVVDYHRARRDTVTLSDATPQLEQKASRDEIRPERMLSDLITTDRIQHAIQRLTEEQQQVLVLRFFQGLSTGEVADMMGKRRGAIRGLQFRALSALRDLLHREQDALTL